MTTTDQLFRQAADAREYVGKIGRAQPHFRDQDTGGYLHTLAITSKIGWQGHSGGTNYWEDRDFDVALSRVVSRRFKELAEEAFALMDRAAEDSLKAEEAVLRERLARIEALKADGAPA